MSKRNKVMIAIVATTAIIATLLYTLLPRDPDRWVENGKMGRFTPLMVAVRDGDLEEIRHQLELGASIDKEATIGWTSLEIAIRYEQYPAANLLLDFGADSNHVRKLRQGEHGPLRMTIEETDDSNQTSLILFQRLLDLGANPLSGDGALVWFAIDFKQLNYLEALLNAMPPDDASEQAEFFRHYNYQDPAELSPEIIEVLERFM
jgi:hypothetical protein